MEESKGGGGSSRTREDMELGDIEVLKSSNVLSEFEPVDELSIIGYVEETDVSVVFEANEACTSPQRSPSRAAQVVAAPPQNTHRSSCFDFGEPPSAANEAATPQGPKAGVGVDDRVALYPEQYPGKVCSLCNLGQRSQLGQGSRAGWQCTGCRVCQICRVTSEDTSKVMVCETCLKAYHSTCLRPVVTTIPKFGWKCKCCRLCSDCGSRTPGAGLSSRWHAHYTVCDSCYQQRNKGLSCPLCHRAYRAAAHREMVQCSSCKRFVHGTCDPDAELSVYEARKKATPSYEYVCGACKTNDHSAPASLKRKHRNRNRDLPCGVQKPQADACAKQSDEERDENKIVLCSSSDDYVLSQDLCCMCGAVGTDQEGCLIACSQCGQSYHPYCVNMKISKVILSKGWRCLDCTVCEGCAQRHDEGRLILCDECDISYHIYCTDPPLDHIPRGTWKCKWCAQCLTCGATGNLPLSYPPLIIHCM
ncbi:histone-lysine N-methyltransferase 2C-like [Diaphorina citri]|uniref:Histone-lysine N-methyltransferase 2C-like n=1 Tax=Diaphorina citri TaxID=121845 RepID=A0A3Q0J1W3_DIACI|nr:histone-lysine N-methyltransferase 2C-like [Diaphorina citri]